MIKIINNIIKDKRELFFYLDKLKLLKMNDRKYLEILYKKNLNKEINWENLKGFNEKLQWLKLYDRNSKYIKLVDKYEVKKYISDEIGEEYIIPTLGVYDKYEDINFENLPNQFVLKCTHDSGGLVICKDKDKLDLIETKKRINKSLKRDYYNLGREWPYKDVKPRIIAEKYMIDESKTELKDYKLFCFNGKVKIILVCSNRFIDLEETFFDENWNLLEVKRPKRNINPNITKPFNFQKMKELAEKLSKDIPFLRVDFYECDKKIYFGELTFYPASGFSKFEPEEWDEKLGEMLKLPEVKNK